MEGAFSQGKSDGATVQTSVPFTFIKSNGSSFFLKIENMV
jgi:hypothetical protein